MHITLSKSDLSKALNIIEKAVAKLNALPLLQGVLISAGEKVELSATNTQVYAKAEVDGLIAERGEVIVDGKLLAQAVKKLSGQIILSTKDNKLEIQSGRSRFKLGIIEGDFPPMTEDLELIHEIDAEQLQRVVKQTTYATKDDPAKPFIGGVLFGEYAVSTDTHRLAVRPLGIQGEFILPAPSLQLLNKLSGQVMIYKAKTELVFCDNKNKIAIGLIDSRFPNWKQLMPSTSPVSVTVDRKSFLGVIDRANLITGDYSAVKITVEEGLLTASIQEQANAFEESLEVEHSGSGAVHLSAKYLADYLKVADTDQVELWINEELKPCLLSAGDYKYILMPVKV